MSLLFLAGPQETCSAPKLPPSNENFKDADTAAKKNIATTKIETVDSTRSTSSFQKDVPASALAEEQQDGHSSRHVVRKFFNGLGMRDVDESALDYIQGSIKLHILHTCCE